VRARRAKRWLAAEGTSVVGLQEGQVDQLKALTRSGEWTSYPDPRQSQNTQTAQSVAWRSAEWSLLEGRTFTIPFDHTQTREQPMVLLRHTTTGRRVWVITMHLTVGGGERALRERRIGTNRLVRHVRELEATGVPVIVTGDMNDRETFFCRVAGSTTLRSPVGGGHDGVCSLPAAMRIDWIFGTPTVQWRDFRYADDALLDRITDHVVPVATATLGGPVGVLPPSVTPPSVTPPTTEVVEDEDEEDGPKHDHGNGNGHGWGRDK
jgi:endonuclease/exonuclease/phosphatase family metal-dependent hydrolase